MILVRLLDKKATRATTPLFGSSRKYLRRFVGVSYFLNISNSVYVELDGNLNVMHWSIEPTLLRGECSWKYVAYGRVFKGVGHLGHDEAMEAGGREFDPRPGHYSRMRF